MLSFRLFCTVGGEKYVFPKIVIFEQSETPLLLFLCSHDNREVVL